MKDGFWIRKAWRALGGYVWFSYVDYALASIIQDMYVGSMAERLGVGLLSLERLSRTPAAIAPASTRPSTGLLKGGG